MLQRPRQVSRLDVLTTRQVDDGGGEHEFTAVEWVTKKGEATTFQLPPIV